MRIIKITPLEQPVFSRVRVGSPDVIVSHSVLEMPLPSTILGILGYIYSPLIDITCNDVLKESKLYGLGYLYTRFKEEHGCKDPLIKGPIIYYDREYYLPIYGREKSVFIPIDSLDKIKLVNNVPYIDKTDLNKYIEHEISIRVGVKLRRELPKMKTVEHMYNYAVSNYNYVELRYGKIVSKQVIKPTFIYFINCTKLDTLSDLVRISGRSRIGRIEIVETNDYKDLDGKVLSFEEFRYGKGILLNPLPLITNNMSCIEFSCYNVSQCIKRIYGLVKIVDDRRQLYAVHPSIKFMQLSLGYFEICKTRRPIIPALVHGSLIEKNTDCRLSNIERILVNIGYGSLIKLP